ncbi:MAG: hypothetical protein MUO73_06985 [Thermoplasmata archaeon]|nr:hypothetical protein [Thermoplasmata archaeon]
MTTTEMKGCPTCGEKTIPVKFCPLIKTDCMNSKKADAGKLPCGDYPSPRCTNEKADCNFDANGKTCRECANWSRRQGGIKGISIPACKISGSMSIPIQSCYKPDKWFKKKGT